MNRNKGMKKRILAAICVFALAVTQAFVLVPEIVHAATAGATLSVRVQYFGDRGDKLKEKASFSRGELEGMGASTYCYSNVTNVGTVMVMKAHGPKVSTIISAAGIDLGSVQNITFRTTDGYTRNFSMSQINGSGYYYPKLNLYSKAEEEPEEPTEPTEPGEPTEPTEPDEPSEPDAPPKPEEPKEPEAPPEENTGVLSWFIEPVFAGDQAQVLNYERSEDGQTLTPRKGSLSGATRVPAILALTFGSSKRAGKSAESMSMGTAQTYRFCLGQSKLTEGKRTRPGYGGGDVSSAESCHSIYGIDVTLYGSSVKGVYLSLKNSKLKVGSREHISAEIKGDELFKEYLNTKNLTWHSSDSSIARVDKNGNVTILKDKAVTITATTPDGVSGSITINGTASGAEAPGKDNAKNMMLVREITLGEKVKEDTPPEKSLAGNSQTNTQKLEATEEYSPGVVAGSAVIAALAFGCGAVFRIRRFKIDI